MCDNKENARHGSVSLEKKNTRVTQRGGVLATKSCDGEEGGHLPMYVAVRGNGADPLNLVEVQAKGKVATVQPESDGNGSRRSLSPSQSHLRAHSQQQGVAGEAGTVDQLQHHQQRHQQEQQPSTTMAALVGAALGMMAIGLVMGLVQVIRSAARAPSSSALLPTAAVTL